MTKQTVMTPEQYDKILHVIIAVNNSVVGLLKRVTALEEFRDISVTEFQTHIAQIEQVQNNIAGLCSTLGLEPLQAEADLTDLINNGDLYIEGITNKR